MLRKPVLRLIRNYQARGGGERVFMVDCNFEPTCSEYAIQAIEKYGLMRGSLLFLQRIRRCTDRDCIRRIHDPVPRKNP